MVTLYESRCYHVIVVVVRLLTRGHSLAHCHLVTDKQCSKHIATHWLIFLGGSVVQRLREHCCLWQGERCRRKGDIARGLRVRSWVSATCCGCTFSLITKNSQKDKSERASWYRPMYGRKRHNGLRYCINTLPHHPPPFMLIP